MIATRALTTFAAATLMACAGSTGVVTSKLDPTTAVTIVYTETPMVFYRDDPGKAAYARNLVHMGPLEVNTMGTYRYYLWLGIWSTLPNTVPGVTRDGFDSIVIYADSEPLTLELSGSTPSTIGASEPVYLRPVASATDAYYEVTVDHLRLIAASNEVRIQSTGPGGRTYELWDNQQSVRESWTQFLDQSVY